MFAFAATVMIAVLSLPVMARALFDHFIGGSGWRQGDWLINFGEGFVRRGLFGEGFIIVSDLTGLPVLSVAQIFQVGLFVSLVFVLWLICLRSDHPRLLMLLAASPAFFLIFWAGDRQGTMRKEMFFLLAMALLAWAALRPGAGRGAVVAAALLFTAGCIGNIMHVFLAPIMIAGAWLLTRAERINQREFRLYCWTIGAMSLLWLVLSILYREVPALEGMCAPLVARGLNADVCGGAMYWLVSGNVDHIAQLLSLLTPDRLGPFALVTLIALVSVGLTVQALSPARPVLMLALVAFLPMLPLYAVATDWGRWFSTSYSGFAFLVIMATSLGIVQVRTLPRGAILAGLLGVGLLVSHEHGIDWKPGGALRSIAITLKELR